MAADAKSILGSSPLARGTLVGPLCLTLNQRFIPACAGNTALNRLMDADEAVHPRLRGEHYPWWILTGPRSGSSPLARGTLTEKGERRAKERFIPACAGNTTWASLCRSQFTVHPRLRGEHVFASLSMRCANGSSPLARGTHENEDAKRAEQRFIPACAGNTTGCRTRTQTGAVHPRLRGEHGHDCSAHGWASGSSPLARGTQHHQI